MKVNADALRSIRESKGFRQIDLASAAGLPKATVCRLELGRRPGTPAQILSLASALGVSVNAITHSGVK